MKKIFTLREPYDTYFTVAAMLLAFYVVWFSPSIAHADYTITTSTNFGNIGGVGQTGRVSYAAPFTTIGAGTMQTFTACLAAGGTPSDNVDLSLEADSAGTPSNTPIATAAVAGSSLTGTPTDISFSFSSPQSLSASTVYWLVLRRDGSLDGTNLYKPCGNTGSGTQAWASTLGTGTWDQDYVNFNQRYVIPIVEGGGGGGGGNATDSTTTASLVDSPTEDLFNGFVIFFMAAFGTMWVLRRRQ